MRLPSLVTLSAVGLVLAVCLLCLLPSASRAEDAKPAQPATTPPTTQPAPTPPKSVTLFEELFSAEKLDLTRWAVTSVGDFADVKSDVVGTSEKDRRLRLRAQSKNGEQCYHGIRTIKPVIDLQHPVEITYDLDWSHPKSDGDMTAGIYICPTACDKDRLDDEGNWISIIYNGYSSAHPNNVYLSVMLHAGDDGAVFWDDGWQKYLDNEKPDTPAEFAGRKIGLVHVRIVLSQQEITVWENDKQVCSSKFADNKDIGKPLSWSTAYLYLDQGVIERSQPPREVFFDNIAIRKQP